MKTIQVCIGSSCHVKGSYHVKSIFEEKIRENHLEDSVELKVAFCLGNCSDGVSVRIDGQPISGVTRENAAEIFDRYLLNDKGE
ncbi:(2Fe-2S) ferredoxin domain-containing protein [Acidaminobacterium chupaoyuni]